MRFNDGLESDKLDVNYDSRAFETVEIKQLPIVSITSRVNPCNSGTYINSITLNFEDGTNQQIYGTNNNGSLSTIDIPKKHVIVGMHTGIQKEAQYKRIHAIGFILMDLSGKK